jgi:SAM-dependent methyltransferase
MPGTLRVLADQRRAWETRPTVRRLYRSWFEQVAHELSDVAGPSVELGSGCGIFVESVPGVLATDVVETPWADQVVDAERLPFAEGSVANLVMIDVFHHVPHPAAVLGEAERVLRLGGRLIMLEPYCSPISRLVYRHLHHEPADMGADIEGASQSSDDPFDANNALPTLLFWRRRDLLTRWVPHLKLVGRRRLAWLVYPLSGGFSKPEFLPSFLVGPALRLERALAPLLVGLMAFRCLVVLQRT